MMANRIIRTNNGFKFEINGKVSTLSYTSKREAAAAGAYRIISFRMKGYKAIAGLPVDKQIKLVFGDIEK